MIGRGGEKHHETKDSKIAVNDLHPPAQERKGHPQGGEDFIFPSRGCQGPSKMHHDPRRPNHGQQGIEQGMDGKEIAPQHEGHPGDQGPRESGFQIPQQKIGEESA